MLLVKKSKKFKKDLKKILANGNFQRDIFENIVGALMTGAKLDERFFLHKLGGAYHGFFECHVQPDVLLIYEFDEEAKKLYLLRIGSHSELF